MANTENNGNTNKVQIGVKVDPDLHAVITQLAAEDDRSLSNMVERLVKQHPQVQELLEQQQAAAATV